MSSFKVNAKQMVFHNQDESAKYFIRCVKDPKTTKAFHGKRQYEMWRKLHSKKCSCLISKEAKTNPVKKQPYSNTLQNGHRTMNNL